MCVEIMSQYYFILSRNLSYLTDTRQKILSLSQWHDYINQSNRLSVSVSY